MQGNTAWQLWDSVWTSGTLGTAGDWRIAPLPQPPLPPETREGEEGTEDIEGYLEDISIENPGGLVSVDTLGTAVLLALFCDARLPDYMIGRFGFTKADQHEYHGNTFGIDRTSGEEPLGSLLWTLRRAPLTSYTARMAEHFCADALQVLVRNRLITGYFVQAEVDKPASRLNILVTTYGAEDREFYAELSATQ